MRIYFASRPGFKGLFSLQRMSRGGQGVTGSLGNWGPLQLFSLDPLTSVVPRCILCSWSGRNDAALRSRRTRTMNIPGPMMYSGTDAEGFAVYLFCGPMQPTKSFRIPAPSDRKAA